MDQRTLRKWHRRLGLVLAVFIVLQAGTGLFLSLQELLSGGHGHASGREQAETALQETEPNARHHSDGHSDHDESAEHRASANHNGQPPQGHANNEAAGHEATEGHHGLVASLHTGGGTSGNVYRALLAVGLLVQIGLGLLIYGRLAARRSG